MNKKLKKMLCLIERMHDEDIVIMNATADIVKAAAALHQTIYKLHENNIQLRTHIRELIENSNKGKSNV